MLLAHRGETEYGRLDNRGGTVRHYRIEKVAAPGGPVLKTRDILARSDAEAVERAEDSPDCPICDVRKDGAVVGRVP
jgi:hypothetical protein